MNIIDIRSDTVTWPTPAMREAMATAIVGDDVYGEDPTLNQLEAEAAALLGKEAAVFVASGTMGNITAILTHCQTGESMILGRTAHIFRSEAGAAASLGGVQAYLLETNHDGTFDLDDIRRSIQAPADEHFPRTKLICLENTYAMTGGSPLSVGYTAQVAALAREHGLKLHIDGARIFNAATALGVPVRDLATPADSLSFCLSKGLCAPIGSILVGSHEFISEARRVRKRLGGSMRQVGILAAAGLIALHEMSQRLHEDHVNACHLAEGLATIPHIQIDVDRVKTNILFIRIDEAAPISADELISRLKDEYNIVMSKPKNGQIRMLTHYWIQPEHVQTIVQAMRTLLS